MNTRPLSVTVVAWMFIVVGIVGFAYHAMQFDARTFDNQFTWVILLRLLAIVGGAFVLKGANWARWLLSVWMAYHVVLSAGHSTSELAVHGALLLIVAFALLRGPASKYFRSRPGADDLSSSVSGTT